VRGIYAASTWQKPRFMAPPTLSPSKARPVRGIYAASPWRNPRFPAPPTPSPAHARTARDLQVASTQCPPRLKRIPMLLHDARSGGVPAAKSIYRCAAVLGRRKVERSERAAHHANGYAPKHLYQRPPKSWRCVPDQHANCIYPATEASRLLHPNGIASSSPGVAAQRPAWVKRA